MKRRIFVLILVVFSTLIFAEDFLLYKASMIDLDNGFIELADGSYMIFWKETEYDKVAIFAQKFDADGDLAWDENKVVARGEGVADFYECALGSDGDIYLLYVLTNPIVPRSVMLQKIDAEGEMLFGEAGVVIGDEPGVNPHYPDRIPYNYQLIANIDSGVYVVRNAKSTSEASPCIKKMDADGMSLWGDAWQEYNVDSDCIYVVTAYPDDVGGLLLNYRFYHAAGLYSNALGRVFPDGEWATDYPLFSSDDFNDESFDLLHIGDGQYILYNRAQELKLQIIDNNGELHGEVKNYDATGLMAYEKCIYSLGKARDGSYYYHYFGNEGQKMMRFDADLNHQWGPLTIADRKVPQAFIFMRDNAMQTAEDGSYYFNFMRRNFYESRYELSYFQGIGADGSLRWLGTEPVLGIDNGVKLSFPPLVFPDKVVSILQITTYPSYTERLTYAPISLIDNDEMDFERVTISEAQPYFPMDTVLYEMGENIGLFWSQVYQGFEYLLGDHTRRLIYDRELNQLNDHPETDQDAPGLYRHQDEECAVLDDGRLIVFSHDKCCVQAFDSLGELLYPEYGIEIDNQTNLQTRKMSSIGSDAIIYSHSVSLVDNIELNSIKAWRLRRDEIQWGYEGKEILSSPYEIISYKVSGSYIAFIVHDTGHNSYRAYVHKIDANGDPAVGWSISGLPVWEVPYGSNEPTLSIYEAADDLLVLQKHAENNRNQISIQRVSSDGTLFWTEQIHDTWSYKPEMAGNDEICYVAYRSRGEVYHILKVDNQGNLYHIDEFESPDASDYIKLICFDNGTLAAIIAKAGGQEYYHYSQNCELTLAQFDENMDLVGGYQLISSHSDYFTDVFNLGDRALLTYIERSIYAPVEMQNVVALRVMFIEASPVSVEDDAIPPLEPKVSIYPNPFNPTTTIRFSIQQAGESHISIYNLKGQKVRTLSSEYLSEGSIVSCGMDATTKVKA